MSIRILRDKAEHTLGLRIEALRNAILSWNAEFACIPLKIAAIGMTTGGAATSHIVRCAGSVAARIRSTCFPLVELSALGETSPACDAVSERLANSLFESLFGGPCHIVPNTPSGCASSAGLEMVLSARDQQSALIINPQWLMHSTTHERTDPLLPEALTIHMEATLGDMTFPLSQIATLQCGDVIRTRFNRDSPITVRRGDVVLGTAVWGHHEGRKALQLRR